MNVAKGPNRVDLQLMTLRPQVRDYISDLEAELDRTQQRNKRLRKNIRSMQRKLETMNLRQALGIVVQLHRAAQDTVGNQRAAVL